MKTSLVTIKAHDGLELPTNLYLPAKPAAKLPTAIIRRDNRAAFLARASRFLEAHDGPR